MRGTSIVRAAGLLAAVALVACQDTATSPQTTRGAGAPAYLIGDAAHDAAGNPDFFFLPPLVSDPSADPNFDAGAFDPTLDPAIEICEADADGCLTAQPDGFPIVSGSDALDAVTESAAEEQYRANWHTDRVALDPARTYRMRVLVAGAELGFADVDVVSSGRELKNVETDEYIPLLDGRTLPIKFRIERGAVTVIGPDGGTVSAMGGAVTLEFPAGAVSAPTGITVLPGAGYAPDPDLVAGAVFDFGPNGTSFAEPVLMTIGYDPALVPSGHDESELVLGHLVGGVWTVVDGSAVDVAAHAVSGSVHGFSFYGVLLTPVPPPPPLQSPLAFVSDRDGQYAIKTQVGTAAVQLTQDTPWNLAADWLGDRIVYQGHASGAYEIWVMNADGTAPVNLTNSPATADFNPAWSPDGCRIAFVRRTAGQYDVWVMNADGTNQVNLTNSPGDDNNPAWSPDGSQIAFGSNRSGAWKIFRMYADGSGLLQVTNDAAHEDNSPDWSPDGQHIVFATTSPSGEIWAVDTDGGNPRHITTANGTRDYGPDWSPDGSRIAFERGDLSDPSGHTDIWLVNPDGTGLVKVVSDAKVASWRQPVPPEFSSYEVQLAYGASPGPLPVLGKDASGDIVVGTLLEGGAYHLYYRRLNPDGSQAGAAVSIGLGVYPDISGDRVVYVQNNNTLMLYDIATQEHTALVNGTATLIRPRINGDGVAWAEQGPPTRIKYLDLTWAPGTAPVELEVVDRLAQNLDVGGRYVVWDGATGALAHITAYDRVTGDTFTVSGDPSLSAQGPRIDGNWVVWQAGAEIRIADISANPIVPRTLAQLGSSPSIDRGLVVFRWDQGYVYRLADDRVFPLPVHVATLELYDGFVVYVESTTAGSKLFVSRLQFGCCGAPGAQP